MHPIAELLTAGVEPSADEARDLARVGEFTASLYARLLHGVDDPPVDAAGARARDMAGSLTERLSASTGTRWAEGMGLGADLLGDWWRGYWDTGAAPAGYHDLEAGEMSTLELIDEAPASSPRQARQAPAARRRRGSMFGPRRATPRRAPRRPAGAPGETLRLRDGGALSPASVEALESGGLYMDDLLAHTPEATGAAGAVEGPGRAPQAARARRSAVDLDGLLVDSRTPALAGAIGWADAAFGRESGRGTGLAVNAPAIDRMVQRATPPAAREGGRSPVYAFFDSVEGDFVSLVDDGGAAESGVAAAVARVSEARRGAGRAATAAGAAPSRRVPSTSLSSLVSTEGATPTVRAWSGGVFRTASERAVVQASGEPGSGPAGTPDAARAEGPSAAPWLAAQVAYDAQGRPHPRASRGALSAPRVQMTRLTTDVAPSHRAPRGGPGVETSGLVLARATQPGGAPAASTTGAAGWRLAADLGPDMPLGATLSRHEVTAGRIASRRGPATGAEAFRPVVAEATGPRPGFAGGQEALDGVAWVALATDESAPEATGVSLAAVPSGRRATMLPASTALSLATPSERAAGARRMVQRSEMGAGPGTTSLGMAGAEPAAGGRAMASAADAFATSAEAAPGRAAPSLTGGVWRPGVASPSVGYRAMAADAVDARQLLVPAAEAADLADPAGMDAGAGVQRRAVAPGLGRTARPTSGGVAPAAVRASRPGLAGDVRARWSGDARAARRALRRPVMTAREVLQTAPLLGPAGPIAEADRHAVSTGSEPRLSRSVVQRTSGAAGVGRGGAATLDAGDLPGSLARLSGPESGRVTRVLRTAGWTEPELAMLQLAPAEGLAGVEPGAAVAGPAAARRAAEATTPGARAATGSSPVQMVRNLARVVTGTEAFTGTGAVEGSAGGESLLGSTATDRYFRGMAPERSRAVRQPGLLDAVGELVALAQSSAGAETVVEASARRGLLQRLERARRGLSTGGATPRAAGAPGLPGVTGRAGLADTAGETIRGGAAPDEAGDTPAVAAAEEMAASSPTGPAASGPGPGYARMGMGERALVARRSDPGEAGLAARLETALDESARGPAGLTRLTGRTPARSARAMARAEAGAAAAPEGETAVVEGGSVAGLGSALAPEMMIGGMRSRTAPTAAQAAGLRGGMPGELARMTADAQGATAAGEAAGEGAPGRSAARRAGTTRTAARVVRLLERAGVRGEGAQDAMVRSMVRSLEGGDRLVASHGALGDFTRSWLGRVDGNRTGLDLEMGDVRGEFQRVLASLGGAGARRSALAAGSPIHEAGVVQQPPARRDAEDVGADRSGLRRVVGEMSRGGSDRGATQRRAARQAAQETNWRFVETGSSAGTSHADLGRLAESVLDAPDAGERVPLPLVAPAVKAVAQTAMRKPSSEQRSGASSRDGRAGDSSPSPAEGSAPEAELSKEAFESLALEMADRIARRMKRDKERRGIWR
ncbi:MAG: hypothetical protein ACQEXJ_11330 [Myxococcota bacterium]